MGVCVLCLFLMVLSAAVGGVYYVGLGHFFFISKFELKYFWFFFQKNNDFFFFGGGGGEDFVDIFGVNTKMVWLFLCIF